MPKRFWQGKKRLAKKYMGNRYFNRFFREGLPKTGDLTHDCDGLNHIISKVEVCMWPPYTRHFDFEKRKWLKGCKFPFVECFYHDTYRDEKGEIKVSDHAVCPCGGLNGRQPPATQQEIEDWMRSWGTPEGLELAKRWGWEEECLSRSKILESGEHVVDERGLLIVP